MAKKQKIEPKVKPPKPEKVGSMFFDRNVMFGGHFYAKNESCPLEIEDEMNEKGFLVEGTMPAQKEIMIQNVGNPGSVSEEDPTVPEVTEQE